MAELSIYKTLHGNQLHKSQQLASVMKNVGLQIHSNLHTQLPFLSAMTRYDPESSGQQMASLNKESTFTKEQ